MAFDFGAIGARLGDLGNGLIDSISEGAGQIIDAYASAESQNIKEAKTNTETLKTIEPEKGQRTDGSTIVAPTAAAPTTFMVDQKTMLIGVAFVVGLIVVARA